MMEKGRSYGSNFFPIIMTFMVYYLKMIEKDVKNIKTMYLITRISKKKE